jgi:transposase-like protein
LNQRVRRELKPTGGSWRVDETYVCVGGQWTYLYRAVDSTGATIDFYLSEQRDAAAARPKGDVAGQVLFIHQILGLRAA